MNISNLLSNITQETIKYKIKTAFSYVTQVLYNNESAEKYTKICERSKKNINLKDQTKIDKITLLRG